MNERIEKLIDDAKLTAVSEMFGDDLAKFAELIVAECLTKAIGAKIRGESIDTLIHNIKEDFGVE